MITLEPTRPKPVSETVDEPQRGSQAARDYSRVARAIEFLVAEAPRQPSLDEIAAAVHVSPYHFQRLFTRWSGISPKRFLGMLTMAHARRALQSNRSLLDAALDAGLSGPSRLHDLFVAVDAVTPGEFKARGAGLTIRYGTADGPFGRALIGVTARGICALDFIDGDPGAAAVERLRARWPKACLVDDRAAITALAAELFAGQRTTPLFCQGTNFQVKVWSALMRVPPGALVSYGALAAAIGHPTAVRAVGSAVARNPIGLLIPCHRVIRGTGLFNDYRWGAVRKRALIGWEAARVETARD